MLTFTQFVEERSVDPEHLAQRTARRYGKRKSFGKWEKVEKGGHIPLTSFNSRKVESVANREWNVREKLGHDKFKAEHQTKQMKISDLKATQPFVRTNDVEKLKSKVSEKEPSHIRVVTHRGEHYIDDGHHAVMAAKMRGEKHVTVKHINLDEYPSK